MWRGDLHFIYTLADLMSPWILVVVAMKYITADWLTDAVNIAKPLPFVNRLCPLCSLSMYCVMAIGLSPSEEKC